LDSSLFVSGGSWPKPADELAKASSRNGTARRTGVPFASQFSWFSQQAASEPTWRRGRTSDR
jgi:hypothetical protein